MGDSGVPRAVFNGGAKGAEAADSLIHAAGSSEAALNILGDYPAYSLRAAAEEMGTLSVPKYQKWLTDNKAAMDKFPELKAQFDTAAKARAVLDDLKAQRAALDDAYPIKPGWGDAEIMQRFVVPGPKGYEAAQQLLDATRGAPQAQEATKDYLAWSLRDAAEVRSGSNAGTLDPGAYSRWMKRYDGFLSHPAMADVRSRFESAAAAQQTLDESIAAHLERKGAYEDSVAKHFLGDADPVTSIGHILKSGTPGAQMADLARLTSADPIARESIQRAVVKYIQRELKSNNPVGSDLDQTYLKSNALQEFIRQHVSGDGEQALRHIMTPEQLDALNSVALDMRRSNLSLTANKAPAGSDTALNRSAMGAATHGAPSTAAMLAAIEASGEVAGHVAGGLLGPLGHLVGKVGGIVGVPYLQKARAVGFSRVDDLVAEAVLHPEKMSALFDKLPTPETAPSRLAVLNAQVRALAASSAMRDDTDQKKEAAGR